MFTRASSCAGVHPYIRLMLLLSNFKAFLLPQLHDAEHHVLSAVGDAAGDWRKQGTSG